MNTNWKTQSVGDIVAHYPRASELFKANRIDFCCGGHRPLGEVMAEQGADETEIVSGLDAIALAQRKAAKDFLAMKPADLADHIEAKHHAYMREALPKISELFGLVLRAHGANHPELFKMHALFGSLRTEIEQHLVKEEIQLFPALSDGDRAETARLAAEIIAEHEKAGALLKQIRHLTGDHYAAPDDACKTYRLLLELMEETEGDLFQHIHLENNILLKEYR